MAESTARVWEEPLVIPTYKIGPAEANPMFYAGRTYQGARGPIYPYPLLDKLSDAKTDETYKAVYLENEFLKFTVLPEIGGRILAGVDKTNGYDFFYRQTVIKPALIGMLGAWISGGVEWNVPHHHRATTFMPVDHRIDENADGSRTVWVGEIELRQRMKWAVGMTIYPGRSLLEITVKVFNRTPLAHSMLYFTNAAVHVNPGYRVIFPPSTEFGTQHAKCEFLKWPVADSVYAGVDYTGGVDVSWWKSHPNWVSIFAWNDWDDFFGGYDYSKDAGTVHYGDHNVSPGKKFFTFGAGPGGRMWDRILTDADGPYLELMAGAYSDNQPDYSWIEPYETRTVVEYWYPVRRLGGIKNAARDAAVNLEVSERNVARVAFNATGAFEDATVILKAGDRTLLEERISISPAKPFVKEIALPEGVRESDLYTVLAASGRELVSYRPVMRKGEAMPKPVVPPGPPTQMKTNEELYLAGSRLEQFHNPSMDPCPYYEEALRRDGDDYRANVALALLYLKRGMFAEAEERLRRAVARATANYTRPKDGEALYYLGVALKAQGRHEEARDALGRAAWSLGQRAASHYEIAEIAMRDGDIQAAFEAVEHSTTFNVFNTRALNLKATILRRAGYPEDAVNAAASVLSVDPLDFRARNERVLGLFSLGREAEATKELAELATLMRADAQSYLELAADYEAAWLWDEAIDVLWRLVNASQHNIEAMVHYTLGYYWERKGNAAESASHYRLGSRMPPDYCFPFRLESITVLESAIGHNPSDARAFYYLGNLLYDIQPEKAIRMWEMSRGIDDSLATVHRNLGFGYARFEKDNLKAIESMKKAIACSPDDPRLFFEIDLLSAAARVPHAERLALLETYHQTVAKRDNSLLQEILLHVLVGNCDKALELMENRHFHIWEGGEAGVHDVYVDALLMRGGKLMAAGEYAKALSDFEAGLEYPDRFELGKPYDGGREPEVHWRVATAHEALGNAGKAREHLAAAVAKERRGTPLAYWQGLAYRKLGRAAEAAAIFDNLLKTGGDALASGGGIGFFEKFGASQGEAARKARAHYLVGLGRLGKGEAARAREELEAALKLDINLLAARTVLETMA